MNTKQIENAFNYFQQVISHLSQCPMHLFGQIDVNLVMHDLTSITKDIEKEFPYYSSQIIALKNLLFNCVPGGYNANPFVFGRIFEILAALMNIAALDRWNIIHPRISDASKSLYLNGHYANAAEDAFIAINERVKRLFQILRPNDKVPDGDTAMTTVFSTNNPLVEFCDTSSETGKNIQKGFMQMLAGSMSALRNPKAHANIKLSADDAMRQLMFASMLMFKIDEAVAYSNIQEK